MKTKDKKEKTKKKSNSTYTIYTIRGCGYCKATKLFIKQKKLKSKEIKVTQKNASDIFKKIDKYTNSYRYFPIIFKNKKFIGGYDQIKKIEK